MKTTLGRQFGAAFLAHRYILSDKIHLSPTYRIFKTKNSKWQEWEATTSATLMVPKSSNSDDDDFFGEIEKEEVARKKPPTAPTEKPKPEPLKPTTSHSDDYIPLPPKKTKPVVKEEEVDDFDAMLDDIIVDKVGRVERRKKKNPRRSSALPLAVTSPRVEVEGELVATSHLWEVEALPSNQAKM